MRWWKMKDIKSGTIDLNTSQQKNRTKKIPLDNVPEEFFIGDYPAAIMETAIKKISLLYEDTWGRPVAKEELEVYFNFVNPKEMKKRNQ